MREGRGGSAAPPPPQSSPHPQLSRLAQQSYRMTHQQHTIRLNTLTARNPHKPINPLHLSRSLDNNNKSIHFFKTKKGISKHVPVCYSSITHRHLTMRKASLRRAQDKTLPSLKTNFRPSVIKQSARYAEESPLRLLPSFEFQILRFSDSMPFGHTRAETPPS